MPCSSIDKIKNLALDIKSLKNGLDYVMST